MTTLYSSTYSELVLVEEDNLLMASWRDESRFLKEDGVKNEINRILGFVKQHAIRNVIVDARKYLFSEDAHIQAWITGDYVPRLVESGVVKYAIVVKDKIDREADSGDEVITPKVEYFPTTDEAIQWIKQIKKK